MIDFLSSLFAEKDFSIRQKNVLKSFLVSFPLLYVHEMTFDKDFLTYDFPSRCMIVSSDIILFFVGSIFFLYLLHRIEQNNMRSGIYFFLSPIVVFTLLNEDNAQDIIKALVWPFVPFFIYAIIMRVARRFDKH